jgi:hypothetical protein
MKKILLLYSLASVLGCSAYGQTADFCERVISYRDGRSDYFIPINIKSESFSAKVVVESYALFDYLKATRGLDTKTYKSFMLNLLKEKQELEMKDVAIDDRDFFLSGKNVKEGSFRIVETSQAFEVVFAQGCEELIRYYFSPPLGESNEKGKSSCKENIRLNAKDLFIRPKYDFAEQNNVIVRLFEMDIPIYRDDISGSLTIAYSTLR